MSSETGSDRVLTWILTLVLVVDSQHKTFLWVLKRKHKPSVIFYRWEKRCLLSSCMCVCVRTHARLIWFSFGAEVCIIVLASVPMAGEHGVLTAVRNNLAINDRKLFPFHFKTLNNTKTTQPLWWQVWPFDSLFYMFLFLQMNCRSHLTECSGAKP